MSRGTMIRGRMIMCIFPLGLMTGSLSAQTGTLASQFILSQAITAFETVPVAYGIFPELLNVSDTMTIFTGLSTRQMSLTYYDNRKVTFAQRIAFCGLSYKKFYLNFSYHQRGDPYYEYALQTDDYGNPSGLYYKDIYHLYQIDLYYVLLLNRSRKVSLGLNISRSQYEIPYYSEIDNALGLSIGFSQHLPKNSILSIKVSTIPIDPLSSFHFNSFYFKGSRKYLLKRLPLFLDIKLHKKMHKKFDFGLYIHNTLSDAVDEIDGYSSSVKYEYKPGYFILWQYLLNSKYILSGGIGLTQAITISGFPQLHERYLRRTIYWMGIEPSGGRFRPNLAIVVDDRHKPLEDVLTNSKLSGQKFFLMGGMTYSF